MEELNVLQAKLDQTDDFLESMELLSQIDDLKIRLGILKPVTCNREDPECINCSA